MSADQKIQTANPARGTRVASVFSGDSYTDRALWQLSLILAEVAASTALSAESPLTSDEELEGGEEKDLLSK